MENVPDILNFGGQNLAEEISAALDELGYRSRYTLLHAANYGVPQMRERFFLVAIHSEAGLEPTFPPGTHRVEFPQGYTGTRQCALKTVLDETHFVATPEVMGTTRAVSVREALEDLPLITAHLEGRDRRGARRFTESVGYRDAIAPSPYARELREWPGFVATSGIFDHVTRCLSDRDYRLFARLEPGDDYPRAWALAERLFAAELVRLRRRAPAEGSRAWSELRAAFVPPYDATKFPNKWRKMEPDLPARTLMAHIGKDTYTHIHFDSKQARTISVREAARLQSFPDGFVFRGTMNPAFRQIGNSVPPLLSFAIARHLFRALRMPAR
jgi:DNA (cytosine-5)-methyltransferase 1